MNERYFFDTYAIVEIIKGNKDYEPYIDSTKVIKNFILAKLSYVLLRDKYPNAEKYLEKYKRFIQSVKHEWIEEAMEFRLKWKDRKVSITDCVGYVMAKKFGVKFLTGDKEFEGLNNVEFVK